MRSFDEIASDVRQAAQCGDATELRRLAEELDAADTPQATAWANHARGFAMFYTGDYPGALAHYHKALEYNEAQDDRSLIANIVGNIGSVHVNMGDYATALQYFRRAMTLTEEIGNLSSIAAVKSTFGIVHFHTGDYPSALEHFHQALALYTEIGNRSGMAAVTGNIGNVHDHMGEYSVALEYFHRAMVLHEELNERSNIAAVIGNIGIVHQRTGDYPAALASIQRALALHEEFGNRRGIASAMGTIGNVYESAGDYHAALEHHRKALALHEELGERSGVAQSTENIGLMQLLTGDPLGALEHFQRALTLHTELGEQSNAAHALSNIVAAYIALDSDTDAQNHLEKLDAMQIFDSGVLVSKECNRATLQERGGNLDGAATTLERALIIAQDHGLRLRIADVHKALRDLAFKKMDLAGYVQHNDEYTRITEEIRGQEATRRLAMLEAEKRIEAERVDKEKHRALLHNTLPPAIAERVLRGETVNDSFDNVAVMFMDMVGFTSMSGSLAPNDVVRLLSEIFTACDTIVAEHGLMKIKTIGDSYMSVAFPVIDQHESTASRRSADAAVAMLQALREHFPQIQVRIGIHCGPVTAGVIGTDRLQYDVWGDTVNVASRMESHGEPGRIHVTEAFATALQSVDGGQWTVDDPSPNPPIPLSLHQRGTIYIKGKGPMTTYWLEGAA